MSSDAVILEGIGEYKFGFSDPDTYVFKSRKGLDEVVVREISEMKGEPEWMLEFRLKALDHFQQAPDAHLGRRSIQAGSWIIFSITSNQPKWKASPGMMCPIRSRTPLTGWASLRQSENSWQG